VTVAWPTHLIVSRPDRALDHPLANPAPDYTACGVRVGNKTWRGYETTAGGNCVDGTPAADSVTCARCLRTKAWAKAPTGAQLQARYKAENAA
jgi:hypothetical protein